MQRITDYSQKITRAVKAELARRDLSGADLPELMRISRTTAYSRLNYDRPFEMDELARFCRAIGITVAVLIASANLAPTSGSQQLEAAA